MSIVLQSSGGGSVTLSEPTTASNFTQTLPAATGTVQVSGNMPAFSAFAGSATSIANSSFTKILFNTEEFDTNNNFASSRFTPTVAGYYQINAATGLPYITAIISIFKNGTEYKRGIQNSGATNNVGGVIVSSLVFLNGSTDYVEIFAFQNSGISQTNSADSQTTYFNGAMMRAA